MVIGVAVTVVVVLLGNSQTGGHSQTVEVWHISYTPPRLPATDLWELLADGRVRPGGTIYNGHWTRTGSTLTVILNIGYNTEMTCTAQEVAALLTNGSCHGGESSTFTGVGG
jgi:hypothetical protein